MKVEDPSALEVQCFTTNTKYSRKETSLHGISIPNMLPEMQQQNGLLSLRKRCAWAPEVSVQEMLASVGSRNAGACLHAENRQTIGTSFSAPIVAGMAAQIICELNGSGTNIPTCVKSILLTGCNSDRIVSSGTAPSEAMTAGNTYAGMPYFREAAGAGMVDAKKSYDSAIDRCIGSYFSMCCFGNRLQNSVSIS